VIGSASAVAVAAYLGKTLVTQLLAKELESYRASLALDLEKTRHALQLLAAEHATRFERLHERRATVIADVYQRLDSLYRFFRLWINPFRETGDLPAEREHALKLVLDLENAYYPNAVWLERATCNALNELILQYYTLWRRFSRDVAGQPVAAVEERWRGLANELTQKIAERQTGLENEFRTILGMAAVTRSA